MGFVPMKIHGAWVFQPQVFSDDRGSFHEAFKLSSLLELRPQGFDVRQVNQSTSAKGVIRGVHWTHSQIGQAKYVSCVSGALWDVVVDLRPESPTFGKWDAVLLSAENKKSLLISENLGHAFLSLQDNTIANYLCSSEFQPAVDRTITPLDPTLAISFREIADEYGIGEFVMSPKDQSGESFQSFAAGEAK